MSSRSPNWKRVIDKSASKSHRSKQSEKYHPKRTNLLQEQEIPFALPHFQNSQYLSSLMNQKQQQQQQQQAKKNNHNKQLQSNIDRRQSTNSLEDKMLSEIQNQKRIKPKEQSKSSQDHLFKKVQIDNILKSVINSHVFENAQLFLDPKKSVDNNFKQCLKFIEIIQKQFREERVLIEKQLLRKQTEMQAMKTKIMQSYTDKVHKFKDPALKKIVSNYGKIKQSPKKLVAVKSAQMLNKAAISNININSGRTPRNTLKKFEDQKQSRKLSPAYDQQSQQRKSFISIKSVKSVRSSKSKASDICRGNFNRIFTTLQDMKRGLYHYRNGDNNELNQKSKKNIVNSNRNINSNKDKIKRTYSHNKL